MIRADVRRLPWVFGCIVVLQAPLLANAQDRIHSSSGGHSRSGASHSSFGGGRHHSSFGGARHHGSSLSHQHTSSAISHHPHSFWTLGSHPRSARGFGALSVDEYCLNGYCPPCYGANQFLRGSDGYCPPPPPPLLGLLPMPADVAHIDLRVPADAQLWVQGVRMRQAGPLRLFETPELRPGQEYDYRIRATYSENGRQTPVTFSPRRPPA